MSDEAAGPPARLPEGLCLLDGELESHSGAFTRFAFELDGTTDLLDAVT